MGGIERGEHNLTMETVMTISTGLGITMSELLLGIENQAEGPIREGTPQCETESTKTSVLSDRPVPHRGFGDT
jgi:hypothetical protein